MKLIRFLLKTSKKMVFLAVISGIISGAANSGLVVLIHKSLSAERKTAALIWGFAGLCLIVLIMKATSEILLAHMGQDAILKLRLDLSRRIVLTPLRRLEEIESHKLMAALTDDVVVITSTLVHIPILCINIAIICGCLIYLRSFSWMLFLGLLGFIVVGVTCYHLSITKARQYIKLARDERDKLYQLFRALTDGIKELKLHQERSKEFLDSQLETTAKAHNRYNFRSLLIYTIANGGGHFILFLVIGLFLFALPALKRIDLQALTGYTLTILYMLTPITGVLAAAPVIGRANVALRRIEELGFSLADRLDLPNIPVVKTKWRQIEMVNVTHVYYREREDNNFTLGPIDLTFYPGETVFLIGGNGSGKTTLVKLITGLYTPEAGEIRFDHQAITEDNIEEYRQLFSTVFSDFYLFENLLGLKAPELDAKAQRYLARFHLDGKVEIKNGRLSTTALSQGQRKRLALLVAYLEDRSFYIFDEWAADQDPYFKGVFYTQLLPELKARGKTVLAVSHDDRYYHLADRVIKLNYGRLECDNVNYSPSNADSWLADHSDSKLR